MDELDVAGQEVVDAVLVDRVGVASAHLHELVMAARFDQRDDLGGGGAAEVRAPELVDQLHGPSLAPAGPRAAIAVPAWTRSRSPGATASTSAVSTVDLVPLSSAQRSSPRRASTFTTIIGTPSSPHVMQCSEPHTGGP